MAQNIDKDDFGHRVYARGSVMFEYESEIIHVALDDERVPKDYREAMEKSAEALARSMRKHVDTANKRFN